MTSLLRLRSFAALAVLTVAALAACSNDDKTTYSTCAPGTQACAGNSIVTCNAEGTAYHQPVACASTCTLTATGPLCDGPGQGGGNQGGSSAGSDSSGGSGGSDSSGGSGGDTSAGGSNPSGGSGGAGGGGGGAPGDAPAVVFLVDISSSAAALVGAGTRWDAIEGSFVAAGHPLEAYQGQVAFGATRYLATTDMCPDTTSLAPSLNNFGAVASFIAETTISEDKSETPTGIVLAEAASALASHPGGKYIIVISDGIPDNCTSPDGVCMRDAILAAQQAYDQGVTTILVSLNNDFSANELYTFFPQAFANAGTGQPVAQPDPSEDSFFCDMALPEYSESGGTAPVYLIADDAIATTLASTLGQIVGDIVN